MKFGKITHKPTKPLVLPKEQVLRIKVEEREMECPRHVYVAAKTKQLVEFGYSKLTETEVDAQITVLLEKGKPNVIGLFMEDEVLGIV